MRANRSHLSQDARVSFTLLGVLFMVTSLAPALRGFWLVPAFSLAAIAALTFALERHGRSRPADETLELGDGRMRHRDGAGRLTELPASTLRFVAEARGDYHLRLWLRGPGGSIEIASCLSLDERRAVAPLVAAALAQTRSG